MSLDFLIAGPEPAIHHRRQKKSSKKMDAPELGYTRVLAI
jgi:hypothetical protein